MKRWEPLVIREAKRSDLADIEDCVYSAYFPYVGRMALPPAPLLQDHATWIDQRFVRVATVNGAVVGVLVMWPEDDHFHVANMAVSPEHQGSGIGTAFLAEIDRAALESDRREIRLHTNEAMTENLSYYLRKGFTETHRATENGYRRAYFSRLVTPDEARPRPSRLAPGGDATLLDPGPALRPNRAVASDDEIRVPAQAVQRRTPDRAHSA